jgi:tRNA U34 5-carboxymethylaminomethyl modifying GTPase MnmE/TrmE
VQDLKAVRALISKTSKSFIAQLKQTSTPLETKVVLAQAQLCLARLYAFPADQLEITPDVLASLSSYPSLPLPQGQMSDLSPFHTALSELLSLHLALRRIPEIDLSVPTLVLVGAPNVGKSSLVRWSSSLCSLSP